MALLPLAIDVNTKQNSANPPLPQCFRNCKEHPSSNCKERPSKSILDLCYAKMSELASTVRDVFNLYLHAHEPPPPSPNFTSMIGWNVVCYALLHRYHAETKQDCIINNITQAGWLLCRIPALWVIGHGSRRDLVIWTYSI